MYEGALQSYKQSQQLKFWRSKYLFLDKDYISTHEIERTVKTAWVRVRLIAYTARQLTFGVLPSAHPLTKSLDFPAEDSAVLSKACGFYLVKCRISILTLILDGPYRSQALDHLPTMSAKDAKTPRIFLVRHGKQYAKDGHPPHT